MSGGAVTWDWIQGVFRMKGEPIYYLSGHVSESTTLFSLRGSITRLAALQCQVIDVDLDDGIEVLGWSHTSLSIINLNPKGGYVVQAIPVGTDALLSLHDMSLTYTTDLDLSTPHIWSVEARRFYEGLS